MSFVPVVTPSVCVHRCDTLCVHVGPGVGPVLTQEQRALTGSGEYEEAECFCARAVGATRRQQRDLTPPHSPRFLSC